MALEITLEVEKTKLSIQDDTRVKVLLHNGGAQPIALSDPEYRSEFPLFKARNKASGEMLVFRRPVPHRLKTGIPMTLEPGETKEWSFHLRNFIRFPQPGEYLLTAEYEWNDGEGVARSEPVELRLTAVNSQFMALTMSLEPRASEFYVFWLEAREKSTRLMRSTVLNYKLPDADEMTAVGEVPDGIEPIPSIGLNRSDPSDTWISWMHGGRVAFRLVKQEPNQEVNHTLKLPDLRARIIPNPLMLKSGNGEILLWLGARDGSTAKIQVAEIRPDGGSEPGDDLILPHANEPIWAQTAFLSNEERRAYLVAYKDKQLHLSSTSWKEDGQFQPLETRLTYPGRLVAAGLTIQPDDRITGLLVVRSPDETDVVTMLPWKHEVDGEFSPGEPESVPFKGAAAIDRGIVRVNAREKAFVALRPSGTGWFLYQTGEGFSPVGGEAGQSKGPIGLFFNSTNRPLFIYTRPGTGFFFCQPSGDPPKPTGKS